MAPKTRVTKFGGNWTQYAHVGSSLCVDFDPSGTNVVSSATHGQILIRDMSSGEVLVRMNGHWNSVGHVRWCPQTDVIASTCIDRTARLWDPESGDQLLLLEHPDAVYCAEFTESGTRLLTTCRDGVLREWNTHDGALREVCHIQDAYAVVPSPVEQLACVYGADCARIVDLATGKVLNELPTPIGEVKRSRWTADGQTLALPTQEALILLDRELTESARYTPGSEPFCVDWSGDGASICVGMASGQLEILEWHAAERLVPSGQAGQAHSATVWDCRWHPSRPFLMTAGVDGSVASWDASDLKPRSRIGSFSRGIAAAEWSKDEAHIVTASADGVFVVWDIERRMALAETSAHDIWIRAIRWHPDDSAFLTASQDECIGLWSFDEVTRSVARQDKCSLEIGPLWDAVWTPRGTAACVSEEGKIGFFDPADPTRRQSRTILADEWLRSLAWDPNDEFFVVTSMGGLVQLRSVDSPQPIEWERRFGRAVFGCAVSPDGRLVGLAVGDGTVEVVSASSGAVKWRRESAHDSEVWSVAFSPDGQRLASSGADGSIQIWGADTGDNIGSFRTTTSCVSVRFGPRSARVLFGSSGAWVLDPDTSASSAGESATTLTDSPLAILDQPSAVDLLNRQPLVGELSFFLHRTAEQAMAASDAGNGLSDGFVVHVGGRWGAGKTTLARFLTNVLREGGEAGRLGFREWCTSEFSAWSAGEDAPPWWAVVTCIRGAILERLGGFGRLRFRWRELNWRFPHLLARIIGAMVGSILLAIGLTAGARAISASILHSGSEDNLGQLANIVTVALPLLAGLGVVLRLVRTARVRWTWPPRAISDSGVLQTEIPVDLPREYLAWLRCQSPDNHLVVIDDLDRCSAEYVRDLLSAVHLMSKSSGLLDDQGVDVPRRRESLCVLVLADMDWLERAIEAGQPDTESFPLAGKSAGNAYLEKIFIASVQLPSLLDSQRRQLVVDPAGAWSSGGEVERSRTPTEHPPDGTGRLDLDKLQERPVAQSTTSAVRAGLVAASQAVVGYRRQNVRVNSDLMHTKIMASPNLAQLAAAEQELIEDYAHLMDPSPRGVKRTLVAFWINRAIGMALPTNPPLTDDEIMRWSILTLRWPTVGKLLRQSSYSASYELAQAARLGRDAREFEMVVSELDLDRVATAMLT